MATTRTLTVVVDSVGRPSALLQPSFLLRVVKGPDRRKQRQVNEGRVRIGARGADLELTDPTVSALHCEIVTDAIGLRVRDLGSKNGVRLRDRRVTDAWIEPGDELVLGESVVRVVDLNGSTEQPLAEQPR